MSRLEVADLVVIAARTLELEPAAALELIDLEAAEAALADARRWCDRDPVEVGAAALLVGLVRHRPLARGNQQVALLATLQFLALHGWDLDLDPPAAARDLVDGLAAGTVGPQEVQAWMAARLRPYAKEDNMLHYALIFLVVAIIAAVLGFTGIAGAAAGIAKILALVFLVLFVGSMIFGRRKSV